MITLRLWQSSLIVIIITFFATFYTPHLGLIEEMQQIFTVAGFFFGLLVGYTLSDRHSRFNKLKTAFARESGSIVYLYKMSGLIGEKFQSSYTRYLERYLIAIFDYKFTDYKLTADKFYELFGPLKNIKFSTKIGEKACDRILNNMDELSTIRKEIRIIHEDRMSRIEWFTLLLLDGLVIFTLLLSKTGTTANLIATTILISASIIVLLFLQMLDSARWKFNSWSVETYQRAFERIGKLRYYPEPQLKSGRMIPPKDMPYRVATYSGEYPNFTTKVKIVKPKRK